LMQSAFAYSTKARTQVGSLFSPDCEESAIHSSGPSAAARQVLSSRCLRPLAAQLKAPC
jgi:hypothetical protein